jgi:hypothetical protein
LVNDLDIEFSDKGLNLIKHIFEGLIRENT